MNDKTAKKTGGFAAALKGIGVDWDKPTDASSRVAIALIDPDPDQPRKSFDQDKLQELADSIRENGLQQPIGVRPNPGAKGRFLIRFGERRYRAAQLLGWKEIDVIVNDTGDVALQALVENLQREDLTPMETSNGLAAVIIRSSKTPTDIGRALGKGKQWVTYHLALQDVPANWQEAIGAGAMNDVVTIYEAHKLSETHPEEVASLVAQSSKERPLSRAAVRALATSLRSEPPGGGSVAAQGAAASGTSKPPAATVPPRPPTLPRVFVAGADGTEIGFLDLTKPNAKGKVVVVHGENLVTRESMGSLRIVRVEP